MTDERTTNELGTITVSTGSDYALAVAGALRVESGAAPVLILPSSLRRTDGLASAVRQELRSLRVPSHLYLPPHPAVALIGGAEGWLDFALHPPDVPPSSITMPARLNGHLPIWTVTDVDAVRGTGPYVLDLPARYAHPRSRLQQLASRRRADAVVDVNLVIRPSCCVVGKVVDGIAIVGATRDPVAAELFALALADEDLSPAQAVTGPWEDRVVQRATELEIGVRIPRDISVVVTGALGEHVRTVLERVAARIGVEIA